MKVTRPPGRDPAGWQSANPRRSEMMAQASNGPLAENLASIRMNADWYQSSTAAIAAATGSTFFVFSPATHIRPERTR